MCKKYIHFVCLRVFDTLFCKDSVLQVCKNYWKMFSASRGFVGVHSSSWKGLRICYGIVLREKSKAFYAWVGKLRLKIYLQLDLQILKNV